MFGYACDRCREKHQSCNHELPCKRCIKANVADTCHYTPKRTRSKNTTQNMRSNIGMPASSLRTGISNGFPHGIPPGNPDMNAMFMGFPAHHQLGMMDPSFMAANHPMSGSSSNPGTPFAPSNVPRFQMHPLANSGHIDPNTPLPNFPPMMMPPHPSLLFPFPSPQEFQRQQFYPGTMAPMNPLLPAQFFPMQPQHPMGQPGGNIGQLNFQQPSHGMVPPFPPSNIGPLHPAPLPMMPQIETRRSITPSSQASIYGNHVQNTTDGSSALDRISLPAMDHRLSQSGGFFLPPPDVVSMMSMMNSGAVPGVPGMIPPLGHGFGFQQRKSNSALCEALLFNSDAPHPEELHGNSNANGQIGQASQLQGFNQGYTFPPMTSDISGPAQTHGASGENGENREGRNMHQTAYTERITNGSNDASLQVTNNRSVEAYDGSNSTQLTGAVYTRDENIDSNVIASIRDRQGEKSKISSNESIPPAQNSVPMSRLLNNDAYQQYSDSVNSR